jgi:hypothetical protein
MPHVYDTGQLLPQRTAIRNAVIQRLQLLARPTLYARAISALAVQLDAGDEIPAEVVRTLQGNNPAILVALGPGEALAAGMGGNRTRIELELSVYVVTSHGRDLVVGRLAGDVRSADVTQDPGADTMVEHVEELLTGWDPGIPGVEEIRLQRESELSTTLDLTIWEVEFSVRVDRTAGRHPALTTLLASIAAVHNAAGAGDANPVIETVTDVEAP